LSGNKVFAADSSNPELSPIAAFVPKEVKRAEDAITKYKTVDKGYILQQEKILVEKAEERFKSCYKTCQNCVKKEVVLCSAHDCDEYFPRIYEDGFYKRSKDEFQKLETELSQLDTDELLRKYPRLLDIEDLA
jgi:hypothetical protein